jgi:hypothetical protein
VSKCEFNYDLEDRAVEIVMHVFLDDLESAIELKDGVQLNLYTEVEKIESDSLINKYLQEVFVISSKQSDIEYTLIGRELSEDLSAVWIYAEAPVENEISEFYIMYNLLTEVFMDQENILQCRVSGKNKKFIRFDVEDQVKKWKL